MSDNDEQRPEERTTKNPAAVALGRLGGVARKSKPWGLSTVSKKKRKQVARLGVEARRRKKAGNNGNDGQAA